jgi:hypothetical protein
MFVGIEQHIECIPPKGHTHHLSHGLFHGFATFSGGLELSSRFNNLQICHFFVGHAYAFLVLLPDLTP